MKLRWAHAAIGVEVFVIAAVPAWLETPTGKSWLTAHVAVADAAVAAYAGLQAVRLALGVQQPQKSAANGAEEQG